MYLSVHSGCSSLGAYPKTQLFWVYAERHSKPSYVDSRVNVCVPLSSARTRKVMLFSFSERPAMRARLARIGGVNHHHRETSPLGLIGDKDLKLTKGPAVQPGSDPSPCPYPKGFCYNGLAHGVIRMLDMPFLTTRDSPQLTFRSPATVGLERTTLGKIFIALTAQSGKQSTNGIIGVMMQPNPVPAPMFLNVRHHSRTSFCKSIRQSSERLRLQRGCQQLQRYCTLVHARILTNDRLIHKRKPREGVVFFQPAPIPPRPEGRGISANI